MASKRDEDSLSEDDGVFNDSQEENDNDEQSASNSEGVSSGEESEAQETDEEDRPKRRRKVVRIPSSIFLTIFSLGAQKEEVKEKPLR